MTRQLQSLNSLNEIVFWKLQEKGNNRDFLTGESVTVRFEALQNTSDCDISATHFMGTHFGRPVDNHLLV